MIDPATATKASKAGMDDSSAAAKMGAKKGIMCNGTEVQPGPEGVEAFNKILAQAKTAGQYEGKPLGPDGMNVNSTFDHCKVQGMDDTAACKVVNAKYGLDIQPNS